MDEVADDERQVDGEKHADEGWDVLMWHVSPHVTDDARFFSYEALQHD
jgi:hypothetical protein